MAAARHRKVYETFFLVFKRNLSLLHHLKEDRVLHRPVMVKECLEFLSPSRGKVFVDCTFGAGGHTCSLLKSGECTVYAVDRDPLAIEIASVLSTRNEFHKRLVPCMTKFSSMYKVLRLKGVEDNSVDGILLDLGASSMQFDDADRGFSVTKSGPLDMRMDGKESSRFTAAAAVNSLKEDELAMVLSNFAQEKDAVLIAKNIVKSRRLHPIETTQHLAAIVANSVKQHRKKDKLKRDMHPATKTFLALRVLVNSEFKELRDALTAASKLLRPGGRLVVISFNWMEDAIVKHFLESKGISKRQTSTDSQDFWVSLHRSKVVEPNYREVKSNPRSRSAKLRAVEKRDDNVMYLGPTG